MEEKLKYKTSRIWITPLLRFRILTNQRTEIFRNNKLVTVDFISDMVATSEKLNKVSERSFWIASIYLAVMYISYSGSGISIKILGIAFSDVPKLLEISVVLFSFSLFVTGVQILRQEILRTSIDSMIGSLLPNDEISQALIRYRSSPGYYFIEPFKTSYLFNKNESIKPVGITKTFNNTAILISLFTVFAIYFVPVFFLLYFVVPSMDTNVFSIGIGIIAWMSSMFLLIAFMTIMVKFPYDETIIDNTTDSQI